jgi:alkylation response protein AidB-like acyl-CoA dehydrogenase
VLKSAWTDQAFSGASACLQVFGGHGYVREWGIEQIVRDARVAMIYEGTNEIQAIDLLVRKVLPDGAAALSALLSEIAAELGDSPDAERTRQAMARFTQFTTEQLIPGTRAPGASPELPFCLADDYLRALAMLLMAWAWSRVADAPQADSPRWRTAQTGFWRWVWPEFDSRMAIMGASLNAA